MIKTTPDGSLTLNLNYEDSIFKLGSNVKGKEFHLFITLGQAEEMMHQLVFK